MLTQGQQDKGFCIKFESYNNTVIDSIIITFDNGNMMFVSVGLVHPFTDITSTKDNKIKACFNDEVIETFVKTFMLTRLQRNFMGKAKH